LCFVNLELNIVKEIKKAPGKVATTRTENGHKQNTKTSTTISTKRTKEHKTTEEEMGGTNFILGIKEQETRLTLHELDDDDDRSKLRISLIL